jgi:PhoH-like ATPase
MTVALGLHFIMDKKCYNKVVLVRNPIGSGMDIGFLPGEFSTKTDAFYAPIVENVDNPEIISFLIEHGMLEKKIPYHMKGLTMKDSYVIIDEAEDLDLKTLRLIGGRIGSNSVMIFSGDFAQTEDRFINDNGLIKLINDSKGHPLVGIVILDENVRSSASQVFMNLKY